MEIWLSSEEDVHMEFNAGKRGPKSIWTKRDLCLFIHVFKQEYLLSRASLIHKQTFHSTELISSGLLQ